MPKNISMEDERPVTVTVLLVILFIVAVGYFAWSGYGVVNYFLSKTFAVETNYTFLDFLAGIVTIIASIILFVGSIFAWKMKRLTPTLMVSASFGFLIKNLLEIIDVIVRLAKLGVVQRYDIMSASAEIGKNIFHVGFWIYVAIFFSVAAYKDKLMD